MTTLAGTGPLMRLIARRDRWLLAMWIGLLAAYPLLMVAYTEDLNPNAAQRQAYAESLAGNPAFTMMYGPIYGSSVGALATWRGGDALWIAGLVSLLVVVRHTRSDEEAGRRELLGATVVGRHAGLAAALIVAIGANLAVVGVGTVGLTAQGLPVAGALALGLKAALVGTVFAAVAAVAAQLTESAAAARGIAISVLGAAFLLRAAGDAAGSGPGSWLSWLSPMGWAHRIRPFADERWWILALGAAVVAVLTGLAVGLSGRRDIGAGVLRPRPGPANAARGLRTPLALAWRLHRGSLLGWVIGFVVMSGVLSGTAKSAADLFRTSPQVGEMFRRLGSQAEPGDMYLSGTMNLFGLVVAAYAVQATLRLRVEEEGLRAEPVLATAVHRLRWGASHLAFALLGPAAALTAAGLTSGLVYGLATDSAGREVPRLLAAALVQLPAAWLLAGVALGLYGLAPRLAAGAWFAWGAAMGIWLLGTTVRLDQWLRDVSPFTHLPRLPGGEPTTTPLLWLTAGVVGLIAIGLAGLSRRDVGRT